MAQDAPAGVRQDTRTPGTSGSARAVAELLRTHAETVRDLTGPLLSPGAEALREAEDAVHWADVAGRLQAMWLNFQSDQAGRTTASGSGVLDVGQIVGRVEGWLQQMPLADTGRQQRLLEEMLALWEAVLGQFGVGPNPRDEAAEPRFPRSDPRFAAPQWRERPMFALLHQTYLLLAEHLIALADSVQTLEPDRQAQLRFTTRAIIDALSPSNFPMTNPVVLDHTRAMRGENLVKGMEHLLEDLRRGQMTHSASNAFKVGETVAVTPGKVIHETPLYQLIQYSPTTETVLETPLVIFPPWINRFYILDLNPQRSFVRWAVEQGLSVFMVSWKSADESMAGVVWDDYIAAQIEVVDVVRSRLGVGSAHAIGYCVAGTTLATTLAVLARKNQADGFASATFFTAQVDFEDAGDLKLLIGDEAIQAIDQLAPQGYLDGRYMAAAFNMLRGNDLIWKYVQKHYLMGEDYPAFDLLFWNGDVTNLPARWHRDYLRDLYRDNRLVVPDSLSACNQPIDLRRIETPCYIQAGREDHIAPAKSVWKLTRYLAGPWTFVLAASGHIAGVVNPPAAGKYRYWINDVDGSAQANSTEGKGAAAGATGSLDAFVAGATEHPGSWWPHWLGWLRSHGDAAVPADGARNPGGGGERVIEDAPGRYVSMR